MASFHPVVLPALEGSYLLLVLIHGLFHSSFAFSAFPFPVQPTF